MRFRTFLVVAVLLAGLPARAQPSIQVQSTLETQPVLGTGTVVQGAALWAHPTDPANSLLLVADNQNGLLLYQTDGTLRRRLAEGAVLGVDVQEGVRVGGISQSLVMVANQSLLGLVAYIIDPTTLDIRGAGLATIVAQGFTPTSVALYVSPTSGRFFAFAGSQAGIVVPFELTGQVADGGAAVTQVRTFDVGGPVVGLAVDDAQRTLYVVEQNVGIWQYGAEPEAADARTSVDDVTGGGLTQPLGGVALYTASGVRGYLLAVSGGDNAVRIYERDPSAHAFRGSFVVVQDGGIDAVDRPRHVVVTHRPQGARFPLGLVAVHDSANTAGNENFKLVPWPEIATRFTTPLVVDTGGSGTPVDGGTPDGGDGGGNGPVISAPPPPVVGEVPPGYNENGSSCYCASVSVPGTVLLVLAGVLLRSRRRPRA
ncbi:myxosortase-dependent phytase-like phosphatase [Archangium sp.]|uniref:myxosortase-dependent phytase-like phosphatase n=1 Tax=Archangium sp. TaxID=1872627 RepID=UPI002D6043BA|nr:myxosortase-dependent phytase-like phosphatase [Archangium sp.]HYO57227.1 phytase [Archangium sp.]